jgi:putative aldouronate transport system substrate-binding protein
VTPYLGLAQSSNRFDSRGRKVPSQQGVAPVRQRESHRTVARDHARSGLGARGWVLGAGRSGTAVRVARSLAVVSFSRMRLRKGVVVLMTEPINKQAMTRRSFLGIATLAAVGAPIAARRLSLGSLGVQRQVREGEAAARRFLAGTAVLPGVLPAYVPNNLVEPDIPSVNGSAPGFLRFPSRPVHTVREVPGAGSTFTTITPLWGAIPPAGNTYYTAVNKALGADLVIQPANGNTYGNALPPLFAAGKLPDWIDIPSWNVGTLDFPQAVGATFVDLSPYLAGDKVKRYPNLAAVPTSGWRAGVWNNKLYGVPSYPAYLNFSGAIFYRADILDRLGVKPGVRSAKELLELGKEVNHPKGGRWAFGEIFVYMYQPFDIPQGQGPGWAEHKGGLIASFETPQYLDLLVWERDLIKAGLMNPADVALESSSAKQRFWSGQTVVYGDGTGAWDWEDAVSGTASDKAYVRQAFAPFTASGTGRPTYVLQNGASLFSYVNKSLSASQVEEVLRIANYLAAPFGSYEYNLVNYGVEGVDYTMTALGPKLTSTGNTDVATTYEFLVSPAAPNYNPGYPAITKASAKWYQHAGKYATKPLFYDLNISVPAQLSAANAPTDFNPTNAGSMINEVTRGRASVSDFKAAVKRWRSNGGDSLRAFYEKVYEQHSGMVAGGQLGAVAGTGAQV